MSQNYRGVNEAQGLQVGSRISTFEAIAQNGNKYLLDNALKKGPVVVIFYRGFWCPVCNRHLSELQDSLKLIYDKGATVVAISPEKPEYLQKTAEKTGAKFTLLYDEDYKISDAFDVTFKPDSGQLFLYNNILKGNLKVTHSDYSERLPIPATFIIDKNLSVIWRQFNPDYKKRASVKEIVAALTN
jgi:peroxiredoxin